MSPNSRPVFHLGANDSSLLVEHRNTQVARRRELDTIHRMYHKERRNGQPTGHRSPLHETSLDLARDAFVGRYRSAIDAIRRGNPSVEYASIAWNDRYRIRLPTLDYRN